jgi:hypothetical protein
LPTRLWVTLIAAVFAGCATSGGVGGESHFVCSRDAECPSDAPSCSRGVCVTPSVTPAATEPAPGPTSSAHDPPPPEAGVSPTADAAPTASPPDAAPPLEAGLAPCMPLDAPPQFTEGDCHQLDSLVLDAPKITDADGDGIVSAGETLTLSVEWHETKGIGVNLYPGVQFFQLDDARTPVGADWRYAAAACETLRLSTPMVAPSGARPGTAYRVRAQVSELAGACPNAGAIDLSFSIGGHLR